MKNIIKTILISLISINTYAICPFPPDPKPPNEGIIPWLGGGFDIDRERIKVISCLNGQKVVNGGGEVSLNATLLTSQEQVLNELERKVGGKIKIAFFSLGGSKTFIDKTIEKSFSQSFTLKYDLKLGNGRFDIDSSDPLNDTADRVKTDACKFKELCGNNFVYQTEEGASVYVAMQFAFTSQEHEQTFKRTIGADLEHTFNVNGVSVKVGAKIDTSVTKLNKITRDNGSLEVVAYQKGGDVTGLARIFSGENSQTVPAFSCSLNNLKACTEALDKIVQYIASKEFAEGVKSSPAILNYAYRPYWEVDPDVPEELKTSEVSTDIENARLRLAEAYENITIDQETLAKTLQLDLATNRQQELVGLAAQLQTDAENVQKAALICFSDLEACVSNTDKVLGNIVTYDRKIIEPNPFTDGLIAYYPFNTNALDESGNDNHGKIHGASLAEDRFGKKNSAYNFDGKNNYISVPPLKILDNLSISFWLQTQASDNNNWPWGQLIIDRDICGVKRDWSVGTGLGGKLQFNTGANIDEVLTSSMDINDGSWYHITVVRNAENRIKKMFINNKLNTSHYFDSEEFQNHLSPINLGAMVCNSSRRHDTFFNGNIDDVRIYNRALSDSEIQQLYNNASNQTKNCKANLLDQKLEIPCVSVPNVVGSGADIYSLDLINTPFTKRFDVDVNTLKKHTFQDSCLADYSLQTGGLNLPCVNVPNDRHYVMKMQQRSGSLIFDLIDSQ
jgi:hypothetical protein